MMNQRPIFSPGYVLSNGRYEMKEMIGRGGMGIVQKAYDRCLGIDVALKFQFPGASEEFKKFFLKEARAMAQLTGHSNIVSIFDIGFCLEEVGNYFEYINFIASEYLSEGNATKLVEEIKEEKSLDKTLECLKVATSICDGIAYAHDKAKILHRDIKPANVLIGIEGIIKVCDFGLAKMSLDESGKFTARQHGTLAYMAPEQFEPNHKPSVQADIWQLGMTLYELLTGGLPHRPTTTPTIEPSRANSHIPQSISECIMLMLDENPNKRPDSCVEVKDLIQKEIDFLDPDKRYSQKKKVLELREFVNIRHALKEQIENGIQTLVNEASNGISLLPEEDEKERWYSTVLMRPSTKIGRNRILSERFSTIFFAEYSREKRIASSNWENATNLITTTLLINECSSGLPIRWYRERGNWERDRKKGLFLCNSDKRRFIRYFALKNIKSARFDDPEDNIIKNTYATDESRESWPRGVGWKLRSEDGSQSQTMSQNIETEILVPIYSPFSQNRLGSPESILGIANFEWDQKFPDWRIEELGALLATMIQDENCFSLSELICDILPNIVLLD